MPEALSLKCVPFTRDALWNEVRAASGGVEHSPAPDQVRYLASYLDHAEVKARTLVVEKPYVDRHFLEEYMVYYANLLRPPGPKTTRIHVLKETVTDDQLRGWLREAATNYDWT